MDRWTLEQLDNQIGELTRHGSPSCIRQANLIMCENFNPIVRFALDLTDPPPKPKRTIADNFPAGGLTDTEPCMFCKDNEQLNEQLEGLQAKLDEQAAEIEELEKCLKIKYKKGYEAGYIEGLRAYAWWKDGVQYVGTCGSTLKEAIEQEQKGK